MSDGFVEPDDGDDGDDPDGQGLPGAVEVDVLVPGDPSFVASWDKAKHNDYANYKEPSNEQKRDSNLDRMNPCRPRHYQHILRCNI